MRKKINKAGNGLMLMMLTCNAVVPSASLVYAEAVQPMNIQLSLNSLAPKIYAGESAVYQMDFKVSGAMEEVNEQLNTAKKREIVIQLPEDTTFYSMPSDEAYLKTLAIASLDKDGQKVEIVPTYDADNHQLIYAFSSLRAGTSARLFLKLDTKNGVTPNNTEMALSAKFAAGEEELASTEAKTKIKAQLPIAATKSFDGVLDEDGKIKEGVIAAKSGDNVQWSVRVEVPTTEVGMSLIKDGEPVIVEDILNDNLSYVSAQGEDMTVNPNGQTVSFSFPTKTRDEQLKLLAEGKSLFVREFTLITKVKEGITEYTEIPNMVTATVTAKEDTQKTTESNKPAVVVSSEGRDSSQVNGSILYPIFYGPKDGNGGYNFDWNHLDANPTVIDTAQLSFYNQYHPMPGTNEPNQNDSDEHITDKNGDDFDWKNNVLTILEKGYQEINMNYTLDEKLTFDSVQINKPVLEYCNDPAEVYPNDYEMNIIVELDNGTKKTIKVNFDELAEDRRPTYQTVYYNREKLGLSENEKVSKYTISLKPLNGQMIDGRTSVLVQPRYGIVPGSKGQATATVSYDVVLYDGQKITRTEGGRGSAATIGSRHVTIVQEEKSKPTIISDVNFTEKDGSLVKVGDNRVNFMVKNLAASASVVKGPVIGNILLPKGVHIKKDDAKEEYYFYNRSGQILKQEAKYTVVDNYNNTGRQLVQVQWDRDRVNPTEVLTFEFGVEVTKDASYHLDLVGYVLAESEQITVPTDEGFQHIAVEKDKEDMDKDTITDEDRVKLKRTYVLMSKKDLQTIKLVKGDLDTDYSYLGKASLGGEIDYRITMTNTTKENITKLGFIDILPSVDDKTVLDNVARGSKFTPTLTGAITVPEKWADKVEIFYSTETNPSRETVLTKVDYPTEVEEITNPTDAADPAWQTAAQVGEDWSSIHSFKIELKPGTVMIPGQDITLNFKMQAPTELSNELLDVNTEGKERAAWNSFAMTTNGLLPIEPQRVGVYVEASSSVTAEYYIEGTNTKLPLPDGATEKVVTDDLIGKAYSDQAVPKRLTDADGKTYVLVEVEGEPTLKDGSAATTGTVAKEEQVIKYQYKEVKGNVIVHYVNEKGEKIKVDVTDTPTTSTGTPYDTTDNKPTTITTEEGKTYKLVPDKTKGEEAGKVVEGTTEVTYVYEEVKGDVIVHYEDEEGNVIKPQVEDTAETSTGTPYDTTDNKPETITTEDGKTYELVPEKTTGNEQGKVVEGTTEVTYVYKLVVGSVTAEYYIEGTDTKLPGENGETIKVVKPEGTPTGEAYSDQAPTKLTDADGKTYVLVEVEGEPTLKDGSAATTGTVAKEEQVIKYQYKEVKGNVIVHYVNEKGDTIKVDVTDTELSSTGTDYDTTDNKPTTITTKDGKTYELVPEKTTGNETGKVVEGTTEVTYVYKEVKGDVIVHYVDEEGNTIKVDVTDTELSSTGTPYDTTDNKPETITTEDGKTYELVPEKTTGNETGKVVEGTTELTYVYKLVVGSVTAEYYIEGTDTKLPGENGEESKVVKPEGTPTGEAYSDQAPTKLTDADGKTYVLVEAEGEPTLKDGSAATTGTVAKEEQVIKYQYKEVKGDVIVHYVDEEGDTIKVDVTDTELTSTGTDYDTTDNKPTTITTEDGKTYELVPDKTTGNETGKVKEGTTEVTYVYKLVVGSVTAEYYIEGTDTKLPGENGETIKVVKPEGTPTGEAYSDQAPTKLTDADGKTYVLVEVEGEPTLKDGSAATTGTVAKEEQVIKYQYKEVKGDVIVHYVDEEGNTIKVDVTDTELTSTGTPYDTTDNKPETITTDDGKTYELVPEKTTGNETGKVVEGTTEVTYVYKLVVGSVTAEYYIEGTDTKLPGENGEESKVVKPEGTPTGEAYSDQAPTKLTDADGKTYVLVEVEGEPTLKDGSAATTGTVAKEEQVIKYQYKEVKGDVIVHYVDEEGNTIKVDVTDTELTSTGTDYDTTDNKPTTITTEDGKTYELVPEKTTSNETGKVVEGTTEVTYVYKLVVGSVTAEYYIEGTDTKLPGENGETIKVVKSEGTPTGEAYSDQAPTKLTDADGKTYVLVEVEGEPTLKDGSAATTGTVAKEEQVIKYQYKEVKGDVVVHYVNEKGDTIKVDVTDTELTSTGTDYDTTDNKPTTITTEDGKTYELVPEKTTSNETGKVVEGTTEVTYVYKEVKGDVVVHYVNEKGEVIKDPVIDEKETSTGTDYDTTDNKPTTITTEDGKTYELVPDKTTGNETGKVVEGTTEVTYVYKLVVGSVTAEYYIEGTDTKLPGENGETIKVVKPEGTPTGEAYSDQAPTKLTDADGKTYVLVEVEGEPTLKDGSAATTGTVAKEEQVIKYQYKEVKGDVVVHYVNEKGDTIKVDVTDTELTSTGTDYDTTDNKPTTITTEDGKTYELVPDKTTGNETGKVVEGTTEVTYVYKEVKGDVVVHYVDEEGNTIKVDVTDTELSSTGTDYDTTNNKPTTITTDDGKTYELVPDKTTGNETGKVVEGTTEVTYVYKEVKEPLVSQDKPKGYLPKMSAQSLLSYFVAASIFVTSGLVALFKGKK